MSDLIDPQGYIDLARRKAGLNLSETLHDRLKTHVADRLAAEGWDSPRYLARLESDPDSLQRFLEAVTIGETYFFREEKQFLLLRDTLLPELFQTQAEVRLWSAACSTGEEAFSLAILADRVREPRADFRVFASDLNHQSLAAARRGEYSQGSFRDDGSSFHAWAQPHLVPLAAGRTRVSPALAERVVFRWANLVASDFDDFPSFHVIFLRNVLIYLDQPSRERVLARLVAQLANPGYLFLSSTETPLFTPQGTELRETSGVYYFAKGSAPPAPPVPPPVVRVSPPARPLRPTPVTSRAPVSSSPLGRECFALINGDGADSARERLLDPRASFASVAERCFLTGLAAMRDGQTDQAVDAFTLCLESEPGWWPARFHRAVLESVLAPDAARKDFVRVKRAIEAEVPGPRPWDDYLEEFSPRYFQGICERWEAKLTSRGDQRGLG